MSFSDFNRRGTGDSTSLRSVILAQQAAIESLEASRRELESIVDQLLSGAQRGAPTPAAAGAAADDGNFGLSKRELEVLALMVAGKTSKEIAAQLTISFKTAVTHRANIMGKMSLHETASVVREAIRRGLV